MSAFALRLPDHIMQQVKEASEEDNTSMNQMLVAFIAESIGHRRGLRIMQERAARADVAHALAILDSVPDVEPDENDRLDDQSSEGVVMKM